MTPTNHPLTIFRAEELWDGTPTVGGEWLWQQMDGTMRRRILSAMRAAYAAGREDALDRSDPLADLTPGAIIRDVTIKGHGAVGDAFISTDTDGPCVATARDWYGLDAITVFTTDDRRTRWTRTDGTWTDETLDGEA